MGDFNAKVGEGREKMWFDSMDWASETYEERNYYTCSLMVSYEQPYRKHMVSATKKEGNGHGKSQVMEAENRSITSWSVKKGPDSISVELFKLVEDYGIDEIATLFNEIYNTVRFHQTSQNLYRVWVAYNDQSYESYHQNTLKNHHDASQK